PREGFIENIRANTALLRRRLRDPRLKIKMLAVGRRSRTDCALVYLEGVVKPELVKEVETRLQHIDVDGVLETGYLEQFIEDSSFSPFPQIQYTERPDKLIASVMEGRIGILLDGTPFGLIVPATFSQFFQSPEDYYERWIIASLSRALRIFASYLATFTPAVYVAIASYHPGLIPTPLALAIAATRQAVPFPVLIEVLIMEGAMELLREAGARLPRPIGETVSIVGAIVMGMLRFPMIFLASVLGLYGVMLGFIVVNVHMVSLKSFGRVYLASFIPYRWQDFKDLILRAPLRTLRKRPELLQTQDKIRQVNRKRLGW
ncbi:MAG: spore germination protein, partial [Clostridia bacterium]|nr:spore germination protein [Clostridia bacterium]